MTTEREQAVSVAGAVVALLALACLILEALTRKGKR